jgi:hypothetical protein
MRQETLEEVAERLAIESVSKNLPFSIVDFTNGYKLAQERSYSEEEVLELLQDFANDLSDNVINIKFWFNKFKKK